MRKLLNASSSHEMKVMIQAAIDKHKEEFEIVEKEWSGENYWDKLFDSISKLHSMLQETGQMSRTFLSGHVTDCTKNLLVEEFSEVYTTEYLLLNGCEGFDDMSDIELMVEVQNVITGWRGLEGNDEDVPDVYEDIHKEVDEAIALILGEVVEKELL